MPERIIAYVRDWGAFDPERPSEALTKIYTPVAHTHRA